MTSGNTFAQSLWDTHLGTGTPSNGEDFYLTMSDSMKFCGKAGKFYLCKEILVFINSNGITIFFQI